MTLVRSIFDHNKSYYETFLRVSLLLYAENSTVTKSICLSRSLYIIYIIIRILVQTLQQSFSSNCYYRGISSSLTLREIANKNHSFTAKLLCQPVFLHCIKR